eukprot:TRINITY_DN10525_c0_g1_i3.p1 TRINITY_DN10525_c0_g1~~TRINITY_DN10525_c0_g1_i3.p1  ORF type:complete len:104 (+),score=27.62 TRINITY_DN10525_c0_g1_i3:131-442(+)
MVNVVFKNEERGAGRVLLGGVVAGAALCWWVASEHLPRDEETGNLQLIVAAFPMFVGLILLEWVLTVVTGFKHKAGRYNFIDAWSSISAGMTQPGRRNLSGGP